MCFIKILRFRYFNRLGFYMYNFLRKLDIFINYKCFYYFIFKVMLVYRVLIFLFWYNLENMVY